MPENAPKLFFENVRYSLSKIKYIALSQLKDGIDVSIKTSDEYEITSVSSESILVNVTRSIGFEPKTIFSLVISASMSLPLTQGEKKFSGTLDELKSYVGEHIESIINNSSLMETISLVASQISAAYGKTPIITSPFLSNKESK